jgi:hypothetical protein
MLHEINEDLAAPHIDELGDEALTHAYDRFRVEGAGHRVIEVGGRRYITAVTPITSAGRNWSTMIVVPEDDFVGFDCLGRLTRSDPLRPDSLTC